MKDRTYLVIRLDLDGYFARLAPQGVQNNSICNRVQKLEVRLLLGTLTFQLCNFI